MKIRKFFTMTLLLWGFFPFLTLFLLSKPKIKELLNHLQTIEDSVLSKNTYYLGPDGSDQNVGSMEKPFKSIKKALEVLKAGDTLYLKEGRYFDTLDLRSLSGGDDSPIVIAGISPEKVVIDGRDCLDSQLWKQEGNDIYSISVNEHFHSLLTRQDAMLFVENEPYVEARWPNMRYNENWNPRKKWAQFDKNASSYGKIIQEEVAKLGVDLTGAKLHLKYVSNFIGTRKITHHEAGSNQVSYEKKLLWGKPDYPEFVRGKGHYEEKFFVSGARSLLDSKEEWHYDPDKRILSVIFAEGQSPNKDFVYIKSRDYGIHSIDSKNLHLRDLLLFATSIQLGGVQQPILDKKLNPKFNNKGDPIYHLSLCDRLKIKNVHAIYTSASNSYFSARADVPRPDHNPSNTSPLVVAQNSRIEDCEFGWSYYNGFRLIGRGNVMTHCVIHNSSLDGWMAKSGIYLRYGYRGSYTTEQANTIESCTSFNSGGVAMYHYGPGPNHLIKNHFFNAGIYSGDISGTYLPYGKRAQGSTIAYNWVHAIRGIGMRCDSWGDEIYIHHNVVWNAQAGCKWQGQKPLFIYNNTYFVNNQKSPLMLAEMTNPKEGVIQGADHVGKTWHVMNNASYDLLYRYPGFYVKEQRTVGNRFKNFYRYQGKQSDHFHSNRTWKDGDEKELFVSTDLKTIDLRPREGSPLIDSGKYVEGITLNTVDEPDQGAYEFGGEYWIPGANWMPTGYSVPKSMADAVELSSQAIGRNWIFFQGEAYADK